MPDSQPKKKRGQKICPECNCVNGVRAFVCKKCDYEFKMKQGRRGPRKIPVKNHQSLIKGDKIRVVGGSGPFYTDINGEKLDTYHRWLEVFILSSLLELPTITVPVGFNKNGLPMGMQIIARKKDDLKLIAFVKKYEEIFKFSKIKHKLN